MGRAATALVASLGLLLTLPFVFAVAAAGNTSPPTAAALDDIPPPYLALYQDATAGRCPTLPWAVLAAIGKIESDHGRIGGASLQPDGTVTPRIIGVALDGSQGVARILDTDQGHYDRDYILDLAVGPMQFLPGTWNSYGLDASRDRVADPHNVIDAIHTAASYLCANGANNPGRLGDAIWAYNHSWEYVHRVLDLATRYAQPVTGSPAAHPALIAAVLANPRLDIYPAGRDDIASGRIDVRVLQLLQALSQRYTLHVSSLRSGHSRCVGGGDHHGCSVSNHWHGRAADIFRVNGRPVYAVNADAHAIVAGLATLQGPLRPDEVGSPWPQYEALPGHFSDSGHHDHIHFGWE